MRYPDKIDWLDWGYGGFDLAVQTHITHFGCARNHPHGFMFMIVLFYLFIILCLFLIVL